MMILMCTMSATGIRSQSTTTTIPENWMQSLVDFRTSVLLHNVSDLTELQVLLTKWDSLGVSKNDQIHFTFNVLMYRVVKNYSFKVIMKKAKKLGAKVIVDNFTEDDLRVIVENKDILDLIFEDVLRWKYPFAIDPETEIFKEILAYDIKKGEKIAEIGAGTGMFSLLLAMFLPDVELFVNELDKDFLEYTTKKFIAIFGSNLEENAVSMIKGGLISTHLEGIDLDKIIVRNTLHHFSKTDAMMHSIENSLKPDGMLFVKESIKELNPNGCEKELTRDQIKKIFLKSNFELIEEIDFSYSVLFKLKKKKIIEILPEVNEGE